MKNQDERLLTEARQKAGHYEILGETYAKFEFFENGWYPYSRFFDVDKVDLILRRRTANGKEFIARSKSSLGSYTRSFPLGNRSSSISRHGGSSKRTNSPARSTKRISLSRTLSLGTSDTIKTELNPSGAMFSEPSESTRKRANPWSSANQTRTAPPHYSKSEEEISMSRISKLILTGLFVCFVATTATAVAREQDVEGSKDHPLISRYPGSFIVAYDQKEFDEYELPVGKARADQTLNSQHLEGKITLIEYACPEGRTSLEIYRNYQMALQKGGFRELFACVDVAGCGTITGDVKKLGFYGGWNNRYLAAKLARPEGDVYAAVNISDYTKGHLYLLVVEIKPMEGGLITVDAAALGSDITRTGHVAVYGIYFDTGKADVKPESDAALKEIAKLLEQDSLLKLYVVGHTDNVGTLASNMDLSRRRANAVTQVLTTKYGVAAARLSAQGFGPLAPVASNHAEEGRAKNRRVELVKQ